MKCFLLFVIGNVGVSIMSFSQEASPSVVAAGGGTAKGSSISLDWTLGEIAVESIKSAKALYTQGFHQPILVVKSINDKPEITLKDYSVSVYPNPATSVLHIQLHFLPTNPLSVILRDGNGKLLLRKIIPAKSNQLQLNVSTYATGAYFLQIQNKEGSILSSYNIIKAQ